MIGRRRRKGWPGVAAAVLREDGVRGDSVNNAEQDLTTL
jgi:hypothetical protein